ncbi:MAG: ribose 5-phosphate isomerase B [Christensenellales bacterium]
MLYLANDHGGVKLKEKIKKFLKKQNIEFVDLGTNDIKSVSYVDYAKLLCKKVLENNKNKGILICKSGIGMSIVANRFKGIRAGLCYNKTASKLCRLHNDCNVLVLKGKTILFKQIVNNFLTTSFAGGRHKVRVDSIDKD